MVCLLGFAATLAAQPAMTNDDLIKLSKAGLSEDFVLNMIQTQPTRLYTDTGRLIEMKSNGISERIMLAAVKKNPPQEPLTTYGLIQLAKAKFSDNFLLDLLSAQPAEIATDASNIVQLKEAGVSERVLSAIVVKSGGKEIPGGTQITVRLIDEIDSEKAKEGDQFRASLDEPITVDNEVVAPRGADAAVKLVTARESGKMTGKTELTVELASVTINGNPVRFDTSSVSQASGSQGVKTAKSAAAVGAVGAIIGAIAGGGKGAAIGAGAGAAAGAGSQVFLGGQRVRIPSETALTFTTEASVKVQ
jgi:hypothetical protein